MSKSIQHTPGPWHLNGYATKGEVNIADATRNWDVAQILLKYAPTKEQGWANARLIAAAPDLLNALGALVNSINDGTQEVEPDLFDAEILAAEAAIEKATKAVDVA